jgi:hypothetical protein
MGYILSTAGDALMLVSVLQGDQPLSANDVPTQ